MTNRKVQWRPIPGYPDYDINTQGEVVDDSGRVEVETIMGSKAYILFDAKGNQFLVRPSELIQMAFPDISDEEAKRWDQIPRTADHIRKDIMAYEMHSRKTLRKLYDELARTVARDEADKEADRAAFREEH